jgi:hypothetical protein
MFVRIHENERNVLAKYEPSGDLFPAVVRAIVKRYDEMMDATINSESTIDIARKMFACESIEIDDNPPVKAADESTWVQAWVRVPAPPED